MGFISKTCSEFEKEFKGKIINNLTVSDDLTEITIILNDGTDNQTEIIPKI